MPKRANNQDVAQNDDLNRVAVEALMRARGVDGYSDLARRMERALAHTPHEQTFERSYVSRVLRGERAAQPSFVVACARALQVPTVAITGEGVDIALEELVA